MGADYAVVHLIDTPDVGTAVITRVLAQALAAPSGLARAYFGDRPGHPVVLARPTCPMCWPPPPATVVRAPTWAAATTWRGWTAPTWPPAATSTSRKPAFASRSCPAAAMSSQQRKGVTIVFIIRLLDGQEVHANDGDELTINQNTGVLTVTRVDGFEEVTTHFSPSAWGSVTHRVKQVGVKKKSA
jgi:hypothetical protein